MTESLEELFLFGEEKMEKAIAQLQKEFGTVERSFNSLIDSNIETEEEKGKDAEERKKKILEDEKRVRDYLNKED